MSFADFIRRKAGEAADIAALAQATISMPVAEWERFEAWVNAAGKDATALWELAGQEQG
jgi:hypothetical protein